MNKQIANRGARIVENMIKKKESLRDIKSFCVGYGFNVDSPESAVYINNNKVCVTIGTKHNYYFVK